MMLDLFESLSESTWKSIITGDVPSEVIRSLTNYLQSELSQGASIYPPQSHWFKALNETPLEDVRVVILGQDPYHGPGQAQGMSFSVPDGMKLPPSLRNIFKELRADLSVSNESGDLTFWAKQGVLLLNAVLTVEATKAGSHAGKGWELITDRLIQAISQQCDAVVFMLWGSYAQKKKILINTDKHLVLEAVHPSPLSAHRGFFGCKHFSLTNQFLVEKGYPVIDWHTGEHAQISMF